MVAASENVLSWPSFQLMGLNMSSGQGLDYGEARVSRDAKFREIVRVGDSLHFMP